MTETQDLLVLHVQLLNKHWPDVKPAREFREEHKYDEQFYELAETAEILKNALAPPREIW